MDIEIIKPSDSAWTEILSQLEHDIYHLPEYLLIEAQRTKSIPEGLLFTEGEKKFFVPYLLRQCSEQAASLTNEKIFDVVSPYGYPGILISEAAHDSAFIATALSELTRTLSEKGVCSAFFRLHTILNPDLLNLLPESALTRQGETVSVDLRLSEAEMWHDTNSRIRNRINHLKRSGMTGQMVPYADFIDRFIKIYHDTMDRVDADSTYYFDRQYFENLAVLSDSIHLCIVESESTIASAMLVTECCGIVQCHLSGTSTKFLPQAPSKLMIDYIRRWAKSRGNYSLHLGGGVGSANDSLFRFKSGFSKQRHLFSTMRLITNQKAYTRLIEQQATALKTTPKQLAESEFFPAYRWSSAS